MSIISWINFFGVWMPFAAMAAYGYLKMQMDVDFMLTLENLMPGIQIGLFLAGLNLLVNLATFENGKRKYGMLDALGYVSDPYIRPTRKRQAMYPDIPKNMKSEKPIGIVIGKKGNKYACNILSAGGAHHTMILGESGCGKTSTVVLDSIICNSDIAIFAIDVKGELSEKGAYLGREDVKIINPEKRSTYGYDVFFSLKAGASKQDVLDVMKDIVYSLIPINPAEQNTFWTNSARDLLLAFLLYFYGQGSTNIIDIVDEIVSDTIQNLVETVFNEAATESVEHKLIVRYHGMADETISGINAQMMTAISVFIDDFNIRYMLRDNTLRATPKDLSEAKSLFLVIREDKLSAYARVLHLVTNQIITEMERRPEGSRPVLMIIDELPRILSTGKIYKLENGLETLRSRNVTMMLIAQSLESLQRAYKKTDVEAMLNNCPYKVILSATSADTQNAVTRWAGKYKEYKYTRGKSGGKYNTSTTMEDKNVVEPSELITLPQENECILISPYGYNRLKKVPYYKDKKIAPVAEEIRKHNKMIMEMDGAFQGDEDVFKNLETIDNQDVGGHEDDGQK